MFINGRKGEPGSFDGDPKIGMVMKRVGLLLLLVGVFLSNTVFSQGEIDRDLYSDTWVGTDALGRTMPDFKTVGPVKTDQPRVVGIFYITWHDDGKASFKSPYRADVTQILQADPAAKEDAKHPLWTESQYHWGESEMGYFLSKDEYVIFKEMSMLTDAGVDVLVLDVTNGVEYWDEWAVLFKVMEQMKAQGNQVPKICFWAFNGAVITVVQDLYDRIYKTEQHKDLWFYWEGKPLLLYNGKPTVDANGGGVKNPNPHYDPKAKTDKKHPHYHDPEYTEELYVDYTQAVKEFFTLRTMWWGYYEWAGERFIGTEDNWSFGYDLGDEKVAAMNPDDLVSLHKGKREEAAVTPAQHPTSMVGKSWSRKNGQPKLNEYDLPVPTYVPWLDRTVEHPEGFGIYFQERWEEALESDPQFLYINDWNEWTAGKYHPGQLGQPEGDTYPWLGRDSTYFFVDQYNSEFNRCVMPMKGGYTDNYYMQMAQNIRRYKGVRPIPKLKGLSAKKIDADFVDWQNMKVEYRDTIGDTIPRDYPGYGGLHYKSDSGRNDMVSAKVAVDESKVYFYVETDQLLTSHTDNNWMLLLIDADQDSGTGWYGYDYLINKETLDSKTTTLMRYSHYTPDSPWIKQANLKFAYTGNQLELAVPRKLIGLKGDAFSFDFHWSDNPADLKDPISLCTHGDSAPNRRFNYRCIWEK